MRPQPPVCLGSRTTSLTLLLPLLPPFSSLLIPAPFLSLPSLPSSPASFSPPLLPSPPSSCPSPTTPLFFLPLFPSIPSFLSSSFPLPPLFPFSASSPPASLIPPLLLFFPPLPRPRLVLTPHCVDDAGFAGPMRRRRRRTARAREGRARAPREGSRARGSKARGIRLPPSSRARSAGPRSSRAQSSSSTSPILAMPPSSDRGRLQWNKKGFCAGYCAAPHGPLPSPAAVMCSGCSCNAV